jgi:chemotaxis protein MotB
MATARFFDTGQAALRPEALPVLDAMGEELAELKRGVRIEGHTDDAALGTSRFHSNWELSGARAAAVVDYLEKAHHLDPALLSAAGMGSSRPLVKNDSPDNRELNRRVELVIELNPDDAVAGLIR